MAAKHTCRRSVQSTSSPGGCLKAVTDIDGYLDTREKSSCAASRPAITLSTQTQRLPFLTLMIGHRIACKRCSTRASFHSRPGSVCVLRCLTHF